MYMVDDVASTGTFSSGGGAAGGVAGERINTILDKMHKQDEPAS
jgi:hypothetical protein